MFPRSFRSIFTCHHVVVWEQKRASLQKVKLKIFTFSASFNLLSSVPTTMSSTFFLWDSTHNTFVLSFSNICMILSKTSEYCQCYTFLITARKRSLGQGNIFTGMCQSFCPWGSLYAVTSCLAAWSHAPSRGVSVPGPMFLQGSLSRGCLCPPQDRDLHSHTVRSGLYPSHWSVFLFMFYHYIQSSFHSKIHCLPEFH